MIDVVLAVGFFPDIREVPVEFRYPFEHGIRPVSQPRLVLRVLVFQPVQVSDLRPAGENMRHRAERTGAARRFLPPAVHPLRGAMVVPAGVVRMLGIAHFPEMRGPLVPRLSHQVEFPHLRRKVVGQLILSVEPRGLGNPDALAAPLLARGNCQGIVHPAVHVEHGLH